MTTMTTKEQTIRVLIAKPGLDGHDRGVKIIARALRDAGMEVIYTGLRQTPEQVVGAAEQEDVDVLMLSSLSGAHNHLFPRIMEELHKRNMGDILVLGGGIIPGDDIPALKKAGIREIFGPGTDTRAIIAFVREHLSRTETSPRR
jgi:methylmalonyl-CoA mutase C-terminal domain/subunit